MKKSLLLLSISLSGLLVKAQIPQPDPDTTAKHFLIVASIGNLQEVTAGKLAMQKGKNADVRAFGQMMVKDQSQAQQDLLQLAKSKKITIPAEAAGGIQPDLPLKNADANFDMLYTHAMVSGHRNKVNSFQTYATTGKDPDVKAYASRNLPTFKAHLAMIEHLEKLLDTGK